MGLHHRRHREGVQFKSALVEVWMGGDGNDSGDGRDRALQALLCTAFVFAAPSVMFRLQAWIIRVFPGLITPTPSPPLVLVLLPPRPTHCGARNGCPKIGPLVPENCARKRFMSCLVTKCYVGNQPT